LWHGRVAYKRTSAVTLYVLQRGLVISIVQFNFEFLYDFIPLSFIDSTLMMGYSTGFTLLAVFALVNPFICIFK
jgi:phospholipid-translocating ATPase